MKRTPEQIEAMKQFAEAELAKRSKEELEDIWIQYDAINDIQLYTNEDSGEVEAFVYPIVENEKTRIMETITSDWIQLF